LQYFRKIGKNNAENQFFVRKCQKIIFRARISASRIITPDDDDDHYDNCKHDEMRDVIPQIIHLLSAI
jgi:hypothetical protein